MKLRTRVSPSSKFNVLRGRNFQFAPPAENTPNQAEEEEGSELDAHTHTRLHLASYTTIAEASKKLQDVGEAARAWLWLRRGTTSNQPTHTRS